MAREKQSKYPLKLEITLVIIVKLFLIFLIWYICFSNPVERHLNPLRMSEHFIGQQTHQSTL